MIRKIIEEIQNDTIENYCKESILNILKYYNSPFKVLENRIKKLFNTSNIDRIVLNTDYNIDTGDGSYHESCGISAKFSYEGYTYTIGIDSDMPIWRNDEIGNYENEYELEDNDKYEIRRTNFYILIIDILEIYEIALSNGFEREHLEMIFEKN